MENRNGQQVRSGPARSRDDASRKRIQGRSNLGKNSLSAEERADPRRRISQLKRKLIERVFGWSKGNSVLRQVKLRGLQRVDCFTGCPWRLIIWRA